MTGEVLSQNELLKALKQGNKMPQNFVEITLVNKLEQIHSPTKSPNIDSWMKKEKNDALSKSGILTCITNYNGMEHTYYNWLNVVAKFVAKHTHTKFRQLILKFLMIISRVHINSVN